MRVRSSARNTRSAGRAGENQIHSSDSRSAEGKRLLGPAAVALSRTLNSHLGFYLRVERGLNVEIFYLRRSSHHHIKEHG